MPNPNTKGISVHVDRELHAEITAYLQENNMKMGDFIALAAQELLRPPSMAIDPELQAEIDAYLEENNATMAEFFAQAAQSQLHPHIPGIGGELQTKIDTYLEEHGMAMDEFIALAAQDELRPKTPKMEVNEVEIVRTFACQIPESLYVRIKEYLKRHNNMTQRAFVLGLVKAELDRDEELLRKQQEDSEQSEEEEPDERLSEGSEAPVGDESPEVGYEDEPEESPAVSDSGGGFEPEDEEVEDGAFLEETGQDKPSPGYIEGELGAAVEVAPNFDYGQDESSSFPEPDDEEENEDYGMNMAM